MKSRNLLLSVLTQSGTDIFTISPNDEIPRFQSALRKRDRFYRPSQSIAIALQKDAYHVAHDLSNVLVESGVLPDRNCQAWSYQVADS